MKRLAYLVLGLVIGVTALNVSAQVRVLIPSQGGTGIGSAVAGDVGKCLVVSDDSPFAYVLDACGSGGSGTPGGSDTQVQYNTNGSFGGDAGFSYASSTDILSVLSEVRSGIFTATSTIATSTFPLLKATTAFHMGSDYFTDLTGAGLQNTGGALTLNATGDWTGTIDGNNFGGGAVGQGDLLYGSAAGTISELAKDANATRYLSNTGASNNPAWALVDLSNGVTGVLPSANVSTSTLNLSHTALGNLAFTSSGHTGTAFRLFGTNSSGAAAEYATSSLRINLSDNIGVLGISQGGLNAAFTDPNADQLMFWDDSASAITGIGTLSGAAISGTTLTINDVTCTDCLGVTEIADSYLLNNGDAGTGVFDFGGATSFEIPNGTGPAVANIGDIAFDTTDMQLLIATTTSDTPVVLPSVQKLWGATIASTSVDFVSGGRIPLPPLRDAVRVTEVYCSVDGGTSVIINLDTRLGGSNTDTLTCTVNGASDISQSTNPTYAANATTSLEIGTISGTVDYVTFSVWGTWLRE
jgi:hypothetical protein